MKRFWWKVLQFPLTRIIVAVVICLIAFVVLMVVASRKGRILTPAWVPRAAAPAQ